MRRCRRGGPRRELREHRAERDDAGDGRRLELVDLVVGWNERAFDADREAAAYARRVGASAGQVRVG
jgi:hypothetical protein